MRHLITPFILVFSLFFGLAHAGDEDESQLLSLSKVEALIDEGDAYIFDVNTPEIWHEGHLPSAVYFNVADWQSLLPEDKSATLVFYCTNRMCMASGEAAKMVRELGYTEVFTMPEGINGWKLSGRQIEMPAK